MKARGQAGSWNCDEWSKKTPKKLPYKKTKKEDTEVTFDDLLNEVLGLGPTDS